MENGEKKLSYCKYVFDREEKRELAAAMALNITDIATKEDQLKAVKSDFKSQIDALQASVNGAATKINNGYEMRNIECTVSADYALKRWVYQRDDNGEIAKTSPMTAEDLQLHIPVDNEPWEGRENEQTS